MWMKYIREVNHCYYSNVIYANHEYYKRESEFIRYAFVHTC